MPSMCQVEFLKMPSGLPTCRIFTGKQCFYRSGCVTNIDMSLRESTQECTGAVDIARYSYTGSLKIYKLQTNCDTSQQNCCEHELVCAVRIVWCQAHCYYYARIKQCGVVLCHAKRPRENPDYVAKPTCRQSKQELLQCLFSHLPPFLLMYNCALIPYTTIALILVTNP